MELQVSTEYREYLIKWNDFDRGFAICLENKEMKARLPTLESCVRWIDSKCKQQFKRVPVLVRQRWGDGMLEGEATSVIDDKYIWVVAKGGERRKVYAADAWLATPSNTEAVKHIQEKQSEIERLESEIQDISDGAERITFAMMIVE